MAPFPNAQKAKACVSKADKNVGEAQRGSWFSSSTTKLEAAADDYKQAGHYYKIDKLFREAGDAYAKEAECRERLKEHSEAANAWKNAANAFKEEDKDLAVGALKQAVKSLQEAGNFRQAADRYKDMGEIYLSEASDHAMAAHSYEQAAGIYHSDGATVTATGMYQKAAENYAMAGKYAQAARLFEVVIGRSNDTLAKYTIKGICLNAFLCWLIEDPVTAKNKLAQYNGETTHFVNTKEEKFARDVMELIAMNDVEAFQEACVQFHNTVSQLDAVKTHLLLTVKKQFESEPSLT